MDQVGWRIGLALLLASLLTAVSALAETPGCKKLCEVERKRVELRLRRCLAAAAELPKAQAARYRVRCRSKFTAPHCDGLPACPPKAKPKQHAPGLTVGAMVFSAVKRGPPLAKPTYAPGSELFARVRVTFTSKPGQTRLWLQLDLRLLAKAKAKPKVVARWDKYLVKQKFLDPTDRRVPLTYTLHGGALLPPDFKAGAYVAEVTARERTSGFSAVVSGPFRVAGAYRPAKKAASKAGRRRDAKKKGPAKKSSR